MRFPILAATAALSLAAGAHAATKVEATGAWSRPAVAGSTGAGFVTVANHGGSPDALMAVESPLARKVEMHQSMNAGGVVSMQAVDRLPLPPGAAVTLAPGGYHLMFIGLTKALKPGDALPATLRFASGVRLKVLFKVGTGAAPVP